MNLKLSVWVVLTNGHPYTWHLSRAAAYAECKKLRTYHPHARFTAENRDAVLVLAPTSTAAPAPQADRAQSAAPPILSRTHGEVR